MTRGLFLLSLSLCFARAGAAADVKDWTILFYAAGDEQSVQESTLSFLKGLERIPSLRADGNVRVVALHDDFGEDPGYRYLLEHVETPSSKAGPDTPPLSEETIQSQLREYDPAATFHYRELDTGSALTLKSFVRWAVEAYPARHYLLVLAGHSWGQQGVMQDFFVDGQALTKSTLIKNYELRRAMEELYREFGRIKARTGKDLVPGGVFDGILIDACVAAQLDVMLEYKDVFKEFIGSALETPFHSIPYETVLGRFIQAVDARPGADDMQSTQIFEETLVKPLVREYVRAHTRGGSLAKAEGQIDTVQAVAVRNARLGAVAERLKGLVESLPDEAKTDWLQGKAPEIFEVSDTDSNADLLRLARGFRAYLRRKNEEAADRKWVVAALAAKALEDSLGYKVDDLTQRKTTLYDDKAAGVWVSVLADELAGTRALTACLALKAFAIQNERLPAYLLPHFFQKNGEREAATELDCGELAEEQAEPADTPIFDRPVPIDVLFGHKVKWDHGVSAFLREYPSHAKGHKVGKRVLSLWIPKADNGPLHVEARLRLPTTTSITLEYLSGNPIDYLKHEEGTGSLLLRKNEEHFPAFFSMEGEPDDLYVAEAHSNGTAFKQGIGIFLENGIDSGREYQNGRLPIEQVEPSPYALTLETYFARLAAEGKLETTAIEGIPFYRAHRINRTLWPDFVFGAQSGVRWQRAHHLLRQHKARQFLSTSIGGHSW